jgi:hypothetical protein
MGKVAAVSATLAAGAGSAQAKGIMPRFGPAGDGADSAAPGKGRIMLNEVTLDTFTPHLNTAFRLFPQGAGPVEVKLVRAEMMTVGKRTPNAYSFHLRFVGPKTPRLEQQTFEIEHPEIGRLNLFLVPVAEDAEGRHYEAIFNRRV